MTLEDTLTSLGDDPLVKSPNYRQIIAFLNGSFSGMEGEVITAATPADVILTRIYSIKDSVQQNAILSKEYKSVRNSDTYRTSLLTVSAILAALAIGFVISLINADGPMTAESADVFKTLGLGLIEILKTLSSTQ